MSWTFTPETYTEYSRDAWNQVADRYGVHLGNFDAVNPSLLEAAGLQPGQRVLDLCTGPGEPALSLAPALQPGGEVVGVDLSPAMVEAARNRARKVKASNVRFEVMNAEDLSFDDASFDAAVHRFGPQLLGRPARSLAEVLRVLRPGGRYAAALWAAPGDRVPFIHVVMEPLLHHAEPDETGYVPSPYELGAPGELAELLEDVGFTDVEEHEVTLEMRHPSVSAYLDAILHGTPVGGSLEEEGEDVREAVLQEARRNLQRWIREDGEVVTPATVMVVAGSRPQ